MRRTSRAALACLAAVLLAAGCTVDSTRMVPLPGGPGTEDDAYTVLVRFANVANLVPKSEVKVRDVTVGAVRAIGLHGWEAEAELRISPDVRLPGNAVARIGQKSLLGAQYVELAAPERTQAHGTLRDGDVIPSSRTNRYPGTEKLLSALSVWLNGGGLRQVRTIVGELNRALSGNEQQARDLIGRLDTLVGSVDRQREQIGRALDAVDGLSTKLRRNADRLGTAVEQLAPGLQVLNRQRGNLTDALDALSRLGSVGTEVLNGSRDALLANLRDLQPTLRKLIEAGDAVPESLDLLGTLLFPLSAYQNIIKGDFVNLAATVDISLPALRSGLLAGTPLEQVLQQARTALEATDPLRGPLRPPQNDPAPQKPPEARVPEQPPVPALPLPLGPASTSGDGAPPAGEPLGGLLRNLLGGG